MELPPGFTEWQATLSVNRRKAELANRVDDELRNNRIKSYDFNNHIFTMADVNRVLTTMGNPHTPYVPYGYGATGNGQIVDFTNDDRGRHPLLCEIKLYLKTRHGYRHCNASIDIFKCGKIDVYNGLYDFCRHDTANTLDTGAMNPIFVRDSRSQLHFVNKKTDEQYVQAINADDLPKALRLMVQGVIEQIEWARGI